jgi:hypothetical protein
MTHHNSPKDGDSAASNTQGVEHHSEQARFLAKMQESVLGSFKTAKEKSPTEASSAVRQILQGFVIEDKSKEA